MTTRKITTMAFIAGIVLGAAATEGFNVYRQSHDSQIFQERLRCKAVADAYVKENSTDKNSTEPSGFLLTLDNVDYSPARNSCVAELETVYYSPQLTFEILSVQDLLSGETLFSAKCIDNCEILKSMLVGHAFDYIMNNASIPLEQEKAWGEQEEAYKAAEAVLKKGSAPAESKSPPKSAPPSGR